MILLYSESRIIFRFKLIFKVHIYFLKDVFDYNGTDFISCVSALQFKPSRFDEICLSKWNEKMKTGAFKYILHIDKEVIVKGRYGFMILVRALLFFLLCSFIIQL